MTDGMLQVLVGAACSAVVAAVGWSLARVIALGSRVTKLETMRGFDSGAIQEIKTDVKSMSGKLDAFLLAFVSKKGSES